MSKYKTYRIYDPEKINKILNVPAVRRQVASNAPDETLDISKMLRDRDSVVALGCRSTIALFLRTGVDRWEGHYLNDPADRHKKIRQNSKKILDTMFTQYKASAIYGLTPRSHRAARVMSRALGFTPIGNSRNADGHDCIVYVMDSATWDQS